MWDKCTFTAGAFYGLFRGIDVSKIYYLTDIPWAPHQLWFYSIYLCFDVNLEFIGGILFIRQEHIVICAFK